MNPPQEIQLITKLNGLTSLDKIDWDISNPPEILTARTNDHITPTYYKTEYKGKFFIIYQYWVKYYDGEHYYWTRRVTLVMLDEPRKRILWESKIPYHTAVNDLFKTVQYKTSKIGDIFDDLLSDDDPLRDD